MTDLPINFSSVPVKASAGKQPGNGDTAQQDAQDFGNVLSRKVADSARPAEPSHGSAGSHGSSGTARSSGDIPQQAAEQENTETARVEDAGSALPADMLAALLAQQNQSATPQPDSGTQPDNNSQSGTNALPAIGIQPALNTQTSANVPGAAGKDMSAALALISANGQAANNSPTVLDTASPQINNPALEGIGYAETFKASGLKETNSTANNQSLRSSVASELAVSVQLPPLPQLPSATAPSSATSIGAALTQPAWGDEFSQKITWMATQRNQSAELHLNPPQLGPLDVVLKMNGDQASAIFTSPHAAVRDAIEQALPKLREMLADSGIMLGNAMVSDQTAKNYQDNSSPKAERRPTSTPDDATDGSNIQEVRVSSRSRHNGMVDTFA